jgi:hypothetical protein
MNSVRNTILTDAYRKARLATIAMASNIRRFFAPNDSPEMIRAIMRRWHGAVQNQTSGDGIDDRLQREAAARALAAANVGNNNAQASSSTDPLPSARTTRADNRRRIVEAREAARLDAIRRDNYNNVQMSAFLAGADSAVFEYDEPMTLAATLRALAQNIANGDRFILSVINPAERNRTFFTISRANFNDLVRSMMRGQDLDADQYKSDVEFRGLVERGGFVTITRAPERTTPKGRPWSKRKGGFCPFTHDYSCEHLTEVLANLGCWKSIETKNYKEICLWLAFRSAGVSKVVLEDIKIAVLRRTMSQKNIKVLAIRHSLYVVIHSHCNDQKKTAKFGNAEHFRVDLGLYRGHYIHYYKTDICSWAINNHDQFEEVDDDGTVSMVDRWWMFDGHNHRSSTAGLNSLHLLKLVDVTLQNHVKQITFSTDGLLNTCFHNKFDNTEIELLEYPEYAVKLLHDKRTPGSMEQCKPYDPDDKCPHSAKIHMLLKELEGYSAEVADKTKALWLEKSRRLGLGLAEQASLLRKAMPIAAKIFFDTETHTDSTGLHIVHTAVYQEEFDEEPHDFHGPDCAQQMLDEINRRFGVYEPDVAVTKKRKKNETPFIIPQVQMFAHNLTYDATFVIPHLRQLNCIEKATNIVMGSGRHYIIPKPGPNSDLLDWMFEEGTKRLKESYRRLDLNSDERRERHLAWKLAISGIRTFPQFLTRRNVAKSYVVDVNGWVRDIVLQAPFEDFESLECQHEFHKPRVLILKMTDTYKMITKPLRDFGAAFHLDQEKEVMPYALFNSEFVSRQMIASCEEIKAVPNFSEQDYEQLMENVNRWGCIMPDGRIDMQRYQSEYCKGDVSVLRAGYLTFRRLCLEKYDLDCSWFSTISSLSNAIFVERGVYDDVYQVAAVPLEFIRRCTVGGRTMCAENKQAVVTTDVQDLDGVSLYPSAMKRLGGYLKGRPKVIDDSTDLDKVDGYFVQIRVLSVGRCFRLPIVRLPSETGSNNWTNEIEGETLYVDKNQLEDLVRHSEIEYIVLRGYYFDEGRNETVVSMIQEMFSERLEYKRLKNKPMSEILKLIMNVAYGICGLKPITIDVVYKTPEEKDNFVQNHFAEIRAFVQMGNGNYRFELYQEINSHFNRQHIACEVLSMSKIIMNEVTCLCEDVDSRYELDNTAPRCRVYYTDTDSMHIDASGVQPLKIAFEEKYGRPLLGKQLGQFHNDFEFSDCYRRVKQPDGTSLLEKVGDSVELHKDNETKAIRSIFLAKKTYIDLVAATDDKGVVQHAIHMRMKRIPAVVIQDMANSQFGGSAYRLYEHLAEGHEICFDLSAGGNCCFRTAKDHTISTVKESCNISFLTTRDIDADDDYQYDPEGDW